MLPNDSGSLTAADRGLDVILGRGVLKEPILTWLLEGLSLIVASGGL
jgi:hypothetical protein